MPEEITAVLHNAGGSGEYASDAYLTAEQLSGTADAGAALATLMSTTMPAAGGRVLLSVGTHRIDANLSVPKEVFFSEGSILQPAAGVVITFARRPNAGRVRIFDFSLGGFISFATGAAEDVFPEWFGGFPSAGTVSGGGVIVGDKVQMAIDALPETGGSVSFGPGIYWLASHTSSAGSGLALPHDKGTITLKGAGMGETNTAHQSRHTTTLRYNKKAGIAVTIGSTGAGEYGAPHALSDLRIDLWDGETGTWNESAATGIAAYQYRFIRLRNVMVSTVQKSPGQTGETAIRSDGVDDFCGWGDFDGVYIRGNFTTGLLITGNPGTYGGGSVRWFGGGIHYMTGSTGGIQPGTRAVRMQLGGGNYFIGCDFDGWDCAVEVEKSGGNVVISRWENAGNNTDIRVDSTSTEQQNLFFGYDAARVQDNSGGTHLWLDPRRFQVSSRGGVGIGLDTTALAAGDILRAIGTGDLTCGVKTSTASYVRWFMENTVAAFEHRLLDTGLFQVRYATTGTVAVTYDKNLSTRLGGRLRYATPAAFTSGDATPSIRGGNVFKCANAAPTTITNFDAPSADNSEDTTAELMDGQEIVVLMDANTTIAHNPSLIYTLAGADIVGAAHKIVRFVRINSIWYQVA